MRSTSRRRTTLANARSRGDHAKPEASRGGTSVRHDRTPKVDDLDIEIMNFLRRDGRAPCAQIARELGYPEGTVRYRMRRLRSKGLLVSFSMPMLDRVARRVLVVFLIQTVPGKAMELVEVLKGHPNVLYLALAGSGDYDVFVSAGFGGEDQLLDFRHRVLGGSGAVDSFESVHLLKTIARSYDFTLPEDG